jgi:hypothetical protein
MAEKKSKERREGAERYDVETKDVGTPNPEVLRQLAEDLPEKDTVQKEIKAGMLATSAQEEPSTRQRSWASLPTPMRRLRAMRSRR